MLKSIKKCIISMQKSGKRTLVKEVNIMKKVMKRSERSTSKKAFSAVEGKEASFASMEISRQIELVFKFIDANGDGKISPLELREFLLCLGHDKSKVAEEANSMLNYLDSNGDGFVDLNEYMDAVMMCDDDVVYDDDDDEEYVDDDDDHNHHHHNNHHGGGSSSPFEDDLMDAFLVFDSDKNGLISARELHKVLKRLGFAKCSLKECDLMIKGVDKDGDGFVNFEEFKRMMMGYGG